MIFRSIFSGIAIAITMSSTAQAVTTTYYGNASQPTFQSLMDISFGIVDVSTYPTGTTTATISAGIADANFFSAPNSYVRSDDLIPNGPTFLGAEHPHVGLNFLSGVNGVGVYANTFDGGKIQVFDGYDGTGNLLGEAAYGNAGGNAAFNFGAITSNVLIRSVIFTCEFNGDLACGVIDPQWGTGTSFSSVSDVPLPAAAWLLLAGIGGLVGVGRFSRSG